MIKNSKILPRKIGHLEFIFYGIQLDKRCICNFKKETIWSKLIVLTHKNGRWGKEQIIGYNRFSYWRQRPMELSKVDTKWYIFKELLVLTMERLKDLLYPGY